MRFINKLKVENSFSCQVMPPARGCMTSDSRRKGQALIKDRFLGVPYQA